MDLESGGRNIFHVLYNKPLQRQTYFTLFGYLPNFAKKFPFYRKVTFCRDISYGNLCSTVRYWAATNTKTQNIYVRHKNFFLG